MINSYIKNLIQNFKKGEPHKYITNRTADGQIELLNISQLILTENYSYLSLITSRKNSFPHRSVIPQQIDRQTKKFKEYMIFGMLNMYTKISLLSLIISKKNYITLCLISISFKAYSYIYCC